MRPSAAAVTISTGREPEHAARDTSGDAKYRGVRKRKWGKWVSEIRLPNSRERIWLGSYDSPEKAARAFDAALFCLRGNNANFNFPDQPPDIPGGTDLHPSQIQAVAAHFANSYLPGTSGTGTSTSTTSSSQLDQPHSDLIAMSTISSSSMELAQSASYMMEADNDNSNNYYIPDYGIYPGFDDYFMPVQPPPPVDHYDHYYESEEVVYDGVYSQDPSFLWNF